MTDNLTQLRAELRARTFSRWESDIQAVMEYEDELCIRAADALIRGLDALQTERDEARTRVTALKKGLDDAVMLLVEYREHTPPGHQPHMIAHRADGVIGVSRALLNPKEQ